MLTNLYIENIAVIEKTNIEFGKGLNVLTGETGAGKSIIIDSISAVLGRRTSRELVRTGADSAFVSATFCDIGAVSLAILQKLGYDTEDGVLMIEREITLSGKNNCKINGRPAPLSILKDLGRHLINIHGQHESYELMSPDLHISYIDALGDLSCDLLEYREHFDRYKELCSILNKKNSDERDRLRRADIIKYQIDEIEAAEVVVGEYDELLSQKNILQNAQKIREALYASNVLLLGDGGEFCGAVSMVSDSADEMYSAARHFNEAETIAERLRSCYYELEDISSELSRFSDMIEDDPRRLEDIELRLELLSKLKQKYGDTEEAILEYLESIRSELESIESFEENMEKIIVERDKEYGISSRLASELSEKRRKVADKFEIEVSGKMKCLDMPSATVLVSQKNTELTDKGIDDIEFLVSTNAGEPPKPVAKVASGGELSRMMLAIKNVLSQSDPTDTLIFDEVDSGISGSAAQKVGLSLKEVSRSTQSLCVTHLPQIASLADSHYLIKKSELGGRTYTEVTLLNDNGRVEELARIIGGSEKSDAAYEYARELLVKSRN